MKRRRKTRRNRLGTSNPAAGFTLLEMLLVLGISTSVLAGSVAIALRAAQTVVRQSEISRWRETVQRIEGHWAPSRGFDYTGLDTTVAISEALVPIEWVVNPTALVNAWGGEITLANNGWSVDITFAGLTKGTCRALVRELNEPVWIWVNSRVYQAPGTLPAANSPSNYCARNQGNTVRWRV